MEHQVTKLKEILFNLSRSCFRSYLNWEFVNQSSSIEDRMNQLLIELENASQSILKYKINIRQFLDD